MLTVQSTFMLVHAWAALVLGSSNSSYTNMHTVMSTSNLKRNISITFRLLICIYYCQGGILDLRWEFRWNHIRFYGGCCSRSESFTCMSADMSVDTIVKIRAADQSINKRPSHSTVCQILLVLEDVSWFTNDNWMTSNVSHHSTGARWHLKPSCDG